MPVLSPLSENVAPDGPPSIVSVTWSPSASVAETVKVISVPSSPEAVAGAVTTGSWFTPVTLTTVVAVPVSTFEAVNVIG